MRPEHGDRRTSLLRQARRERGWTLLEVVGKVRAICSEATGQACRLNVEKLHRYEDGTRYPGPAHVTALCHLFEKSPQELGLTV